MSEDPTHTAIESVAFVSLGCPKNLVDSEKMLGLLAEDGLIVAADESEADAIVINTCGFLEAAKEESLEVIREAAERKDTGTCRRLIVAGCLVQRHRAKLLQWCPQIDALLGVFDRDRIVNAVRGESSATAESTFAGRDAPAYSSIAANDTLARRERGITGAGYHEADTGRLRLTPRHTAYLRIGEGCNQHCTFCTIPSIRGKMRSKPVEHILAEATELFSDGAFELNLIGQDTTSYGDDLGYEPGLVGMLSALDQLAGEFGGAWLRLMYAYPSCMTDAMIDALASLENVLPYLDIPLQHINDDVLNTMRRRTGRRQIESLLDKLRDRVPGIAIRTTFISGFPGETDAQHDELVRFIRDFDFEHLGVFAYSPEPGTPAGSMHAKGQAVDDAVIARRIDELMLAQQERVFARNQHWAERQQEFDVLIDGETERGEGAEGRRDGGYVYLGRTKHQAPQIDPLTYVQSENPYSPGEVVRCRVIGHENYDLIAEPMKRLSVL